MKTTPQQTNKPSSPIVEEIWNLIRETRKDMAKSQKEWEKSQKEREKSQKEREKFRREWEKGMEELRVSQQETAKALRAYIGDSGNRWGKLGENLVKGSLAQRLNEKGIKVERVITNLKNKFSEFDLVVINGKEVVVVEVKATLDPSDVYEFIEDIENFKIWWPEFKNKRVYGAMAFLIKANKQAAHLAQKQGFFVIEATGDVIIQNKENFKPKTF